MWVLGTNWGPLQVYEVLLATVSSLQHPLILYGINVNMGCKYVVEPFLSGVQGGPSGRCFLLGHQQGKL